MIFQVYAQDVLIIIIISWALTRLDGRDLEEAHQ